MEDITIIIFIADEASKIMKIGRCKAYELLVLK